MPMFKKPSQYVAVQLPANRFKTVQLPPPALPAQRKGPNPKREKPCAGCSDGKGATLNRGSIVAVPAQQFPVVSRGSVGAAAHVGDAVQRMRVDPGRSLPGLSPTSPGDPIGEHLFRFDLEGIHPLGPFPLPGDDFSLPDDGGIGARPPGVGGTTHPGFCRPTRYYVRPEGTATGEPDREDRPFARLRQAIEAAERRDDCEIVVFLRQHDDPIRLFPGEQPIRITRPTTIIGDFVGSMSRIRNGLLNLHGHHLSVRNLMIESAHGWGILQNGGSLILEGVLVAHTHRRTEDGAGGVGIVIQGGAAARFLRVRVRNNERWGLYVYGSRTTLTAEALSAYDNSAGVGSSGGIVVAQDAVFIARRLVVARNPFGLLATRGGTAYVHVASFVGIRGGEGGSGINVASLEGGRLDLHDFVSQRGYYGLAVDVSGNAWPTGGHIGGNYCAIRIPFAKIEWVQEVVSRWVSIRRATAPPPAPGRPPVWDHFNVQDFCVEGDDGEPLPVPELSTPPVVMP